MDSYKIVSSLLDILEIYVKEGISLLDIDRYSEEYIRFNNGIPATIGYKGYKHSVCTSVNNIVCHGIPTNYILKTGDIVKVDIVVYKEGIYGDSCRTYIINNDSLKDLDETTYSCLWNGISIVKSGIKTGDIGYITELTALNRGFKVVRNYCGHGIRNAIHEEPNIPFYGKKNTGTTLKVGDIITIEPMVYIKGGYEDGIALTCSDGWSADINSLSAQYEHTLLVTNKGCIVKTYSSKDKLNKKTKDTIAISIKYIENKLLV